MNYTTSTEKIELQQIAEAILGVADEEIAISIALLGLQGTNQAERALIEQARELFSGPDQINWSEWEDQDIPKFVSELVSSVVIDDLHRKLIAMGDGSDPGALRVGLLLHQVNSLYERLRPMRFMNPEVKAIYEVLSQIKYALDSFGAGMSYQLHLLTQMQETSDSEAV